MNRFPRYGYPFPYYNNYYRNNYYKNYTQPVLDLRNKNIPEPEPSVSSTSKPDNRNSNKLDSDKAWLDLFGIKLYFDDVLILSLLYFLYNENVKDEGLFLSLVMLLIS